MKNVMEIDGYKALMHGVMCVMSGVTNKVQTLPRNVPTDNLVPAGMRKMSEEKK